MIHHGERRRVLIGTGSENQSVFRELFGRPALDRWSLLEADSFSRARFMLQYERCDVLLVNDDLYEREGGQGLAWLAWQREIPIVLLIGQTPDTYARAFQLGVSICLPREAVLAHPPVLTAALDQAVATCQMRFSYQRVKEQLAQCRRHTDGLVNLLWRSSPRTNEIPWFPQRYVMERLCEELARTKRHGIPLAMVLGEVGPPEEGSPPGLPDWAVKTIVQSKRRCDVAGQYGAQGFLLLLVHTKKEGAVDCCRRLHAVLTQPPHDLQPPHRPLQTFFGVATLAPGQDTPQSLLRRAEENLEAARAGIHEGIAVQA